MKSRVNLKVLPLPEKTFLSIAAGFTKYLYRVVREQPPKGYHIAFNGFMGWGHYSDCSGEKLTTFDCPWGELQDILLIAPSEGNYPPGLMLRVRIREIYPQHLMTPPDGLVGDGKAPIKPSYYWVVGFEIVPDTESEPYDHVIWCAARNGFYAAQSQGYVDNPRRAGLYRARQVAYQTGNSGGDTVAHAVDSEFFKKKLEKFEADSLASVSSTLNNLDAEQAKRITETALKLRLKHLSDNPLRELEYKDK